MHKHFFYTVFVLLFSLLSLQCSNVVPEALEKKLVAKQAETEEYQRALKELWVLTTTKGKIFIRLFPDDAPNTVAQVRDWTLKGIYNQTWFHRVVRTPRAFIVQAGDPESAALPEDLSAKERTHKALDLGYGTADPALVPEKTTRKHKPGAVAIAVSESGLRAGPQFIICLTSLPHLDEQEPVFGQVVGGWSVVEQLEVGDRIERAELLKPGTLKGTWYRDIPE